MNIRMTWLAIAAMALAVTAPVRAQDASLYPDIATKTGQVAKGGQTLHYTAHAGYMPIRVNTTGEIHGMMFFSSYALDQPAGKRQRPIIFAWNGGPGGASGGVHMAFGPKRYPGGVVRDNPDTLLDVADLVFIDPIGTGWSRPTKEEYGVEFYQTRGDAESVAEFIRAYRVHYDLTDSPIYLFGESYGGTRAGLVADILSRRNLHADGVILMSGSSSLATMRLLSSAPASTPAQTRGLLLPSLTAGAYVNKKLAPDLQNGDLAHALKAAEDYASGPYSAALAHLDTLTDAERGKIAAEVARFTGLTAADINPRTLTLSNQEWANKLLAGSNEVIGLYDVRIAGPKDPNATGPYDPTRDPSLTGQRRAGTPVDDVGRDAAMQYIRNVLGYRTDLNYQAPWGGGYPTPRVSRADWMSTLWNKDIPREPNKPDEPIAAQAIPDPAQALQAAMAANPNLRVIVVGGYFDTVIPYYPITAAARALPPQMQSRVVLHNYPGGHGIGGDPAARALLVRDLATFIRDGSGRAER